MNFLSSPEIVTAMAFSGRLSFNPVTDSIPGPGGKPFRFEAPSGVQLPQNGFTPGTRPSAVKYSFSSHQSFCLGDGSYTPSPTPTPIPEASVEISPNSQRLEILEPFRGEFPSTRGMELPTLTCLMRVRGKCTTDHISAAVGPYNRRGALYLSYPRLYRGRG